MALRTCTLCGYSSDNLEEFVQDKDHKYGHRNRCKICEKERTKRTQRERRKLINDLKRGKPCEICGVVYHPCAMDYHHAGDKVKEFSIASYCCKPRITTEELLKEVAKCMLLCANCHRILHYAEEE